MSSRTYIWDFVEVAMKRFKHKVIAGFLFLTFFALVLGIPVQEWTEFFSSLEDTSGTTVSARKSEYETSEEDALVQTTLEPDPTNATSPLPQATNPPLKGEGHYYCYLPERGYAECRFTQQPGTDECNPENEQRSICENKGCVNGLCTSNDGDFPPCKEDTECGEFRCFANQCSRFDNHSTTHQQQLQQGLWGYTCDPTSPDSCNNPEYHFECKLHQEDPGLEFPVSVCEAV
ncbi:MAG: hypothetical protein KDD62_11525, partial [Bdellovibrionales bacterium]|nr:hypothetical protein [Bdellovibrionales bacterium]